MASCKDCIQYDVCEYADNLEYADFERLKHDCPRFQNKASFVKVVRCKDCKWYQESEILPPNKFCFRLKHPVEDRQIGYNFAPYDFCSYGERKEK